MVWLSLNVPVSLNTQIPDDPIGSKEAHLRIVDALRVNVDLISGLAHFKTLAMNLFTPENCSVLDDTSRAPDEVLDHTTEVVDTLCLLDRLKEMRQSMTNDLLVYKR